MKITICIVFLFLLTGSVLAVDGYKELKFGMTDNQLRYSDFCAFSEDNPKKWYGWLKDYSRLKVYTCHDHQFADRKITASLTFIDQRLHRVTLLIKGSSEFNELLLEVLKEKYGLSAHPPTINLTSVKYKFDDKTVEAEILHPSKETMLIHYSSDQFGWFMSNDPHDRAISDEL